MTTSPDLALPPWDVHGVLPPIRPGAAGHSADRAPYPVDALTVCVRFGGTPERRALLRGLLALRQALRGVGIVSGHQWIDGSFLEDVETLRGCPPRDIDVVTFAELAAWSPGPEALAAAEALASPGECARRFGVDHYLLRADAVLTERYARRLAYWYSMWARQRETERWKGFVSVDLNSNDAEAEAWLEVADVAAKIAAEGAP